MTTDETNAKNEKIKEQARKFASQNEKALIDNEFAPMFIWEDEEENPRLVAFADFNPESRDYIPSVIRLLTASIPNVDMITMVTDTYLCKGDIKDLKESLEGSEVEALRNTATKLDGTPWQQGDMQYAWENNTPDKALLTECFCYYVIYQDGSMATAFLPYEKDEQAGTIDFNWDDFGVMNEDDENEKAAKLGGFFPDLLRAAMQDRGKAVEQIMKVGIHEALSLDAARAEVHVLCMAVKMVMRQMDWRCMIPARSEEEKELLRVSFTEGPMAEGFKTYDEKDIAEIVMLEEAFDLPAADRP